MRVETQRYTERFGLIQLHQVQKVLELDSGRESDADSFRDVSVLKIEEDTIRDFEHQLVIVIPVKDERLKLLEGVISGIPHDCQVIVVSNSKRRRIDRFRMEKDALKQFCQFTGRSVFVVHQKDPVIAQAFAESGYSEILEEDGFVRDGKCEGMIISILLAMLLNKNYIGFIDADNYFPGSVLEYVRCYAVGFSLATSPYSMVRILWSYKPKISQEMFFSKMGRVSAVTNKYVDSLISASTGFETDIIRTANAGEHAMSLNLAKSIPYATGYAVETQELVSIFEGFGGVLPLSRSIPSKHGVEIFQIETRNPHLHEERGTRHLQADMLLPSLAAIYHSRLCNEDTKKKIMDELISQKIAERRTDIPKPRIYKAPMEINMDKFRGIVLDKLESYSALRVDE